jgi:hypothetical protein
MANTTVSADTLTNDAKKMNRMGALDHNQDDVLLQIVIYHEYVLSGTFVGACSMKGLDSLSNRT